jgi:hypothetical protein
MGHFPTVPDAQQGTQWPKVRPDLEEQPEGAGGTPLKVGSSTAVEVARAGELRH